MPKLKRRFEDMQRTCSQIKKQTQRTFLKSRHKPTRIFSQDSQRDHVDQ